MKVIDARGLACPQPVVLTKRALAETDEVTTLVDNDAARENLRRLGASQGCRVEARTDADGIHVVLRRAATVERPPPGGEEAPRPAPAAPDAPGRTVLLVAAETIGRGSDELGQVLVRAFCHTLGELTAPPDAVVLMNGGVRLVVEGSAVLDDLRALAARGVDLLVCGTCLGFFELKDRLAVGRVSNMYEIAETLFGAGRVIRL
jgi:selenium metabolism protein YedF